MSTEEFDGQLRAAATMLGVDMADEQAEKLLGYLRQLQRWNKTYNLTAIRDPQQMLVQHVFDSLAVVTPLDEVLDKNTVTGKVVDVGSGAGLPGIVLAIMRPNWDVTCVDAVEKKMAFVRQAGAVLGVPNVRATHQRIEAMDAQEADVVTSRAFASLVDFAELAGRHVQKAGHLVAMKGRSPDDEIAALHAQTEWRVTRIQPLSVPQLDAERCLVWMSR